MSLALPLALAALVPVMVGPLPLARETITARLCGGGTLTISLGTIPLDDKAPADDGRCHPKGCHAGTCRNDKWSKLISRKDG